MYNQENSSEVIEKAVLVLENNKSDLTTKEIIEIIDGKFDKLGKLSEAVNKAKESAEKAKELAMTAKNKSIKLFGLGTKDAIESLQNATVNISEAMQISTQAQEKSFDFQTQLAEISKYLFGLGINPTFTKKHQKSLFLQKLIA